MTAFRKSAAAVLGAATIVTSLAFSEQAAAAPFTPGAAALSRQGGMADKIYWRGRGGGWGWWGPGAIVGGLVGGALIAAAISEHRAAPRDMDRCARDFPDFSYRTGTYIDRRGDERVCPYLR